MLSIIGSLFAARQHGVEDEAAPPTEAWFRLELILDAALQCSSPAQGEDQHVAQRVIRRVAVVHSVRFWALTLLLSGIDGMN